MSKHKTSTGYHPDIGEFFESAVVRRSRRERKCDGCRIPIRAGEQYERTFSVTDGQIGTTCHHLRECPPTPEELAAEARERAAEMGAWA